MHTLASSEDDDPVSHLPDERWTLEDVDTGRPDRGPESSPLERFTGTFDACLPDQPNTLSSAYSQRGVPGFKKRIQISKDGHVTLNLSGRLGCAQQIDLLPELLIQHVGQPMSLVLSNNALKPTSLPSISKLMSDSSCSSIDLSSNSDLLSSALHPIESAALATFFLSSDGPQDSMDQARTSATGASCDSIAASKATALCTLLLNSCQIHTSAAEAIASSLLQQSAPPLAKQGSKAGAPQPGQYEVPVGRSGKAGEGNSIRAGLKELHLASASLDDAAFASLLSPRPALHRCFLSDSTIMPIEIGTGRS